MSQNIEYQLNMERINFLIKFYRITREEFLRIANDEISEEKNKLEFKHFEREIKLSTIKKIDKVFKKGLAWYVDEEPLEKSSQSSVFYRKNDFNSEIKLEDIRVANEFEEKKILTQILCRNIDYDIKRKIRRFTTQDDPESAVKEVIKNIEGKNWGDTKQEGKDKEYLKNLCEQLENFGVFVFEYLEHHNKKERVNFNGFYLRDAIIIKRQGNLRREIFTLLHEFAHFLLDEEEIDQELEITRGKKLKKTEKWCNDFAFEFLTHKQKTKIAKLNPNKNNGYCEGEIQAITQTTFINPIACYLSLYHKGKIDRSVYLSKEKEISDNYQKARRQRKEELKRRNENMKLMGEKPPPAIPKAIKSRLFNEIVNRNFDYGMISDVDYCDYLQFSQKQKDKFFRRLYR